MLHYVLTIILIIFYLKYIHVIYITYSLDLPSQLHIACSILYQHVTYHIIKLLCHNTFRYHTYLTVHYTDHYHPRFHYLHMYYLLHGLM